MLKIDREEDIKNVGACVGAIARWNKNVAMKLVDSVLLKIDREEDIEKTVRCITFIARGNQAIANEILIRLNPILGR